MTAYNPSANGDQASESTNEKRRTIAIQRHSASTNKNDASFEAPENVNRLDAFPWDEKMNTKP